MPSNQAQALALLAGLEQLQIAYYLRIIPELELATARAAVSSILASDAQHLALLRLRSGQARGPVRVRDVSAAPSASICARGASCWRPARSRAPPRWPRLGCDRRPAAASGERVLVAAGDAARLTRVLSMAVLGGLRL